MALLVHGAGGGGWEWNVWTRVFAAADYTVVAPDLQPVASGLADTRLDDYLGQVIAAAQVLRRGPGNGGDPVLVGASLGGLLALLAAPHCRPRSLILVNPLPPAPWHVRLPARAASTACVPWRRDARLHGTQAALAAADAASALYAFRRWRDESGAVLEAAMAGRQAAAPDCPLLVLASDDDRDIPPAVSAAVAGAYAGTFLARPGGHLAPLVGRDAADAAQSALDWLAAARC